MRIEQKRAVLTALSLALLIAPVIASERLDRALESVAVNQELAEATETENTSPQVAVSKYWQIPNGSATENRILKVLQDRGITDRVALSVVMGNIRQESNFKTTICEGGSHTGYHGCRRGGFGLIQWTTVDRYQGLGRTAKGLNLDPNSLDAQLAWMFKERQWQSVEHIFKTPGKSVSHYMNAAYKWLGWGIHGARTQYSNQYMNRLVQS